MPKAVADLRHSTGRRLPQKPSFLVNPTMEIELVSLVICPFAQRTAITLLEKEIDFTLNFLNQEDPPEWFRKVSPLGQVPVLRLGDRALFESAAISDYLDEVYLPRLHPEDPLTRAEHRAWIAFGSGMLVDLAALCSAGDEAAYTDRREVLRGKLLRLDAQLSGGPYWAGQRFHLVDVSYAPFLLRLGLLTARRPELATLLTPRLEAWSDRLLSRPSVVRSVADDFEASYVAFFREKGSLVMRG